MGPVIVMYKKWHFNNRNKKKIEKKNQNDALMNFNEKLIRA